MFLASASSLCAHIVLVIKQNPHNLPLYLIFHPIGRELFSQPKYKILYLSAVEIHGLLKDIILVQYYQSILNNCKVLRQFSDKLFW